MISKVDTTTELPFSAERLRGLLQDPERLLRVAIGGRDIHQKEGGEWQVTEDPSLLRRTVTFTVRFVNTDKGVKSDVQAPFKITTQTEWTVEELPAVEGQESRCSLRELTELKCPWYMFLLVKAQKAKTRAALPQRCTKELQQQEKPNDTTATAVADA